ncbi:BURP domain-containing protein, partial [Salmonella sp. NW596]|uniref:BURP domain-containing protein n=1 Tax=Salmonella sp. NW596 TaxID=2948123 RepID=UPI003F4404CE
GDIKGQLSSFLLYHNHNQDAASNLGNHGAASKLNSGGQLENKNGQLSSFLLYDPASEEQLLEKYQNMTLFLLEKDMHPGGKMNFPFDDHHHVHGGAKVLTRQASQSIPFSLHKFPEILNLFSIKPESKEAFIMKTTIEACEEPAKKGEDKYCATSLEGMVDFVASKLGKDVRAMASIKEADDDHDRFLTISAVKNMKGDDNNPIVSCHGINYVYPVFYCHGFQEGTRVYEVPLAGAEGMVKAKANVVCHTNTSTWDPNHLSFQLLGVKPGTVPICHFLPENNVVWATSA